MSRNGPKWGAKSTLTGRFDHGIDAKGRLTVPSQMRRELGEVCYVIEGPKNYLNVYSAAGWEKFKARFEGQSQSKAGEMMRFLFSRAATCEVDGQGRILIPQELRDYAGIGKSVTVVGLPDRAEIWDSEAYRAADEAYAKEKTMAEIYEELGL